jgi:AcrR family transcriptional regulator
MAMPVTTEETEVPPGPSRVQRRRHRKVVDILAAASEVLAERGYADTNLDEVAERLDVSKASLYHYFPSKEALVLACLDALGSEVNRQLEAIAANTVGTARDRLVALIEGQLNIIVHESPQLVTLFQQSLDWPESYRERIKELRREHYGIFRSVVHEGIAAGEFTVDDENVALHNLYGAMNYVPVWFSSRRKKDFQGMSHAVVENLLRLFAAT